MLIVNVLLILLVWTKALGEQIVRILRFQIKHKAHFQMSLYLTNIQDMCSNM